MANYKNYINGHRYDICKATKNHSSFNYLSIKNITYVYIES